MSSSEKLDRALEKLRAEGHQIGDKGSAMISAKGDVLVMVDGVYRTYPEVYELAGFPQVNC